MVYVIVTSAYDYVQCRGGYDWGRVDNPWTATWWDDLDEAFAVASALGIPERWWVEGYCADTGVCVFAPRTRL